MYKVVCYLPELITRFSSHVNNVVIGNKVFTLRPEIGW